MGDSVCAAMILTAHSPANGAPSIPFSLLEEIKRVLEEHGVVRVAVLPADDLMTIDAAAAMLGAKEQLVREMLHLGVLKRGEGEASALVRRDSVLSYQQYQAAHPKSAVDEIFDELQAEGLC